jgi:hypothetical protein
MNLLQHSVIPPLLGNDPSPHSAVPPPLGNDPPPHFAVPLPLGTDPQRQKVIPLAHSAHPQPQGKGPKCPYFRRGAHFAAARVLGMKAETAVLTFSRRIPSLSG